MASILKCNDYKKVLVLYTGGTFGMVRNSKNALEPIKNEMVRKLKTYPNLYDELEAQKLNLCLKDNEILLPFVGGEKDRIIFTIHEYDPLLDSSNIQPKDWCIIADDIRKYYDEFHGFVVLHGTDTLSYTASALSYLLENLGKTVIVTGSQIPIFETRTDGVENFTSSLIIAANHNIPEVCIFFNLRLFRGNRSTKVSCEELSAFSSPNYPLLAKMTTGFNIDKSAIRPCTNKEFRVYSKLEENVEIFKITPMTQETSFRALLHSGIRGIVMESLGSGNCPSNREGLLMAIKEATDSGILIINVTQCTHGSVSSTYEVGRQLKDLGVIPGFDMTTEAALTKLCFVLSFDLSFEDQKTMLLGDLRGELTRM